MANIKEVLKKTGELVAQYPLRIAESFRRNPRQAVALTLISALSLPLFLEHAIRGDKFLAGGLLATFIGAQSLLLTNGVPAESSNTQRAS
ncbi:hypothetical protein HY345_01590 [Candidatus Microgenomates bacterium]|nr:hypothetical protein [Candidatus Microgenomates bacterium]